MRSDQSKERKQSMLCGSWGDSSVSVDSRTSELKLTLARRSGVCLRRGVCFYLSRTMKTARHRPPRSQPKTTMKVKMKVTIRANRAISTATRTRREIEGATVSGFLFSLIFYRDLKKYSVRARVSHAQNIQKKGNVDELSCGVSWFRCERRGASAALRMPMSTSVKKSEKKISEGCAQKSLG